MYENPFKIIKGNRIRKKYKNKKTEKEKCRKKDKHISRHSKKIYKREKGKNQKGK